MERIAHETLPKGVRFEWTDLTYQQILAGNSAVWIFPICVLLVFLVLAAQYESLTLPLAVILIVPMSLFAAMLGVWVSHGDNNIFTQIGLVVLVGLACKNAILIVEFARELELQGRSIVEAAIEACRLRLRPGGVDRCRRGNAPCHGRGRVRGDAGGDAVRPVPHAGVLRAAAHAGHAPRPAR